MATGCALGGPLRGLPGRRHVQLGAADPASARPPARSPAPLLPQRSGAPQKSGAPGYQMQHPMIGTPPQLMAVPTHYFKVTSVV